MLVRSKRHENQFETGKTENIPITVPVLRYICTIKTHNTSVSGIRIRRFLGLPDPDPLVRRTDPDPAAPDPSLFS